MIDPALCALPTACFPPELVNFVFPILAYLVTQVAKTLHRDAMFVWKVVCAIMTIAFCVFLWNPMEAWYIQIPAKGMLVVGFSAGMWHLIKKLTGQDKQDQANDIATGVAAGIAISDQGVQDGTIVIDTTKK